MYFLLNMGIFNCYVSLPECTTCNMLNGRRYNGLLRGTRKMYCSDSHAFFPRHFESKNAEMVSPERGHIYMCWGLNSPLLHVSGDGHQPNDRVYVPIKRISY